MKNKNTFLIVALLVLAELALGQSIPVPSRWYSNHFKLISFLSDSTLEIERGYFPTADRCNGLTGLEYNLCQEQRLENGLYTQRQAAHYRIENQRLIITNWFGTPSTATFSIPFRFVGTDRIQFDFTDAQEWFPHRSSGTESAIVQFSRIGEATHQAKWDSLEFNNLTVYRDGTYALVYGTSTDEEGTVLRKRGMLPRVHLQRIDSLIAFNPLLKALIPHDSVLQGCAEAFREFHVPVPADGSSIHCTLYQPAFRLIFGGDQNSFPLLLKALFDELTATEERIGKFLIHTASGTFDVEGKRCLYWYRGNPIQHKDIPYDWVQWGGLVQRGAILLAADTTIKGHELDYIFRIHSTEMGLLMHSDHQSSLPLDFHYYLPGYKKTVLEAIGRYLK